MSYKLEKPFTQKEYADFIVKYNHKMNLRIEETITDLFALEDNEIIQDGTTIENPNYEEEIKEKNKNLRIEEIKLKLSELDLKTIRALREGGFSESGKPYLEIYQNEIDELRNELQKLT